MYLHDDSAVVRQVLGKGSGERVAKTAQMKRLESAGLGRRGLEKVVSALRSVTSNGAFGH